MNARRLLAALACVPALDLAAQAQSNIQRGVSIAPESVTVGDPFRVVVRVRAPRGTVLDFPDGPDTTFKVEPLDPVALADAGDTTAVEVTATYRLAAWDVGERALRFPDILATRDGETLRVPVGNDLAVTVVSVLPADSSLHVPKPARAVYEFGLPWWWWAAVLAAVAALGALFWWWWRRRPKAVAAPVDPYEEAQRSFERIAALGLVAAGEGSHHVSLVTDVVREYLARVRPGARVSSTTSELLHALRADRAVSLTRLARVLHDADLVKFARRRLDDRAVIAHTGECRALVDEVHKALQNAVEQARAA